MSLKSFCVLILSVSIAAVSKYSPLMLPLAKSATRPAAVLYSMPFEPTVVVVFSQFLKLSLNPSSLRSAALGPLTFDRLIAPSTIPTTSISRKSGKKAISPCTATAPLDTFTNASPGEMGACSNNSATPLFTAISMLLGSIFFRIPNVSADKNEASNPLKLPRLVSSSSLVGFKNSLPCASNISIFSLSWVLPSAGA